MTDVLQVVGVASAFDGLMTDMCCRWLVWLPSHVEWYRSEAATDKWTRLCCRRWWRNRRLNWRKLTHDSLLLVLDSSFLVSYSKTSHLFKLKDSNSFVSVILKFDCWCIGLWVRILVFESQCSWEFKVVLSLVSCCILGDRSILRLKSHTSGLDESSMDSFLSASVYWSMIGVEESLGQSSNILVAINNIRITFAPLMVKFQHRW